ncbi:hypothetical protein [Pseudomonas violetae]|uniref:Uncharacterized protein n=1 Tax=Pseudomonas violetae TaxID=2915813 RepID=A0ABT0EU23_9PSED|nr:hypothetical protein [Pseudomonas violetae]MCK1788919.1 hypothetical protein [Pseudomonas violetae]
MQTYNVDVAYLQEEDAFSANQLVQNWPSAANPFLKRSGGNAQTGAHGSLALEDFAQWLGELALALPAFDGVAVDLHLTHDGTDYQVEYTVGQRVANIDPPIEADNPGFVRYALQWFANHRPKIRLFVTDGVFWVQGQ